MQPQRKGLARAGSAVREPVAHIERGAAVAAAGGLEFGAPAWARASSGVRRSGVPCSRARSSSRRLWRDVARREAYQADITYGQNSEFGFDTEQQEALDAKDGLYEGKVRLLVEVGDNSRQLVSFMEELRRKSELRLASGDLSEFEIVSALANTPLSGDSYLMAPGMEDSIVVRFTPNTYGSRRATIRMVTNDSTMVIGALPLVSGRPRVIARSPLAERLRADEHAEGCHSTPAMSARESVPEV